MSRTKSLLRRAPGYLLLLAVSLLVQTLPLAAPRPLGLLLAGLAVACREPLPVGICYGGLCGLAWAGASGRSPLLLCLLVAGSCLAAYLARRWLCLSLPRYLLLTAAAESVCALQLGFGGQFAALAATVVLCPLWYWAVQWITED